jgi:hypothetical protein
LYDNKQSEQEEDYAYAEQPYTTPIGERGFSHFGQDPLFATFTVKLKVHCYSELRILIFVTIV